MENKIKTTCNNCHRTQYIQVIPNRYDLFPKYCGKCGKKFSFLQKLKNRSMWILIDIRDRIMNH